MSKTNVLYKDILKVLGHSNVNLIGDFNSFWVFLGPCRVLAARPITSNYQWELCHELIMISHLPRGEKCNLPKFAHETNPCAKIATKFAHEFAHMHFLSLQRLNLLEICVQVCI